MGHYTSDQLQEIKTQEGNPTGSYSLTREELLSHGFVFLNYWGDGEKPLIKGFTVTLQDGTTVDAAELKVLTREQLQAVKDYQQAHPEQFGTNGIPLEELGQDMMLFLYQAEIANKHGPFEGEEYGVFRETIRRKFGSVFADGSIPEEDKQLVNAYFAYQEEQERQEAFRHMKPSEVRKAKKDRRNTYKGDAGGRFIRKYAKDIYPWEHRLFLNPPEVRGKPTDATLHKHRKQVFRGYPSPFLDSGFSFAYDPQTGIDYGTNYDATVHIHGGDTLAAMRNEMEGTPVIRINSLSLLLAANGLNEMGDAAIKGGRSTSFDQHYATTQEYANTLFSPAMTSDERKQRIAQSVEALKIRLPKEGETDHQLDQEEKTALEEQQSHIIDAVAKRMITVAQEWKQTDEGKKYFDKWDRDKKCREARVRRRQVIGDKLRSFLRILSFQKASKQHAE